MKKLILMVASLMITSPINAESFNDIVNSQSYTLKCMASRRCKDGVKQIYNISDIASSYPNSNFDIVADEFNRMLTSLKGIGVEVFLGDEKYFPPLFRGVYSTRKNNIYLNEKYMSNPARFITTMRHEGWHVAQDCKAGIKNKKMDILISEKYIPKPYHDTVEETYASTPNDIPYEKEAYWAAHVLGMTEAALESCIEKEDKYVDEKVHQYTIKYVNEVLRGSD